MRKFIGLALVLGLFAAANAGDTALVLGAPAPSVKVVKWLKGKELKKFEPGKVYVVEFWATWCGPCKQSIPHLTELAHKYKDKVSFNGISIWEESQPEPTEQALLARVDKFVKDWGPKMDYNVGSGGSKATMAQTWMAAAGQGGIPSAFIVDQQGRVAWVGHPMAGLEETLNKVLDGSWDIQAEAKKQSSAMEAQRKAMAKMKPYRDALKAKDYKTAIAEIDKLIAEDPKMEMGLAMAKFTALLNSDEPTAYAYAKALSEGIYAHESNALNSIAWAIVDDKSPAKNPDFPTAIGIAQKAADLIKEDGDEKAYVLDTLAYAYFKSGDYDKAIATQTKAVALADREGTKIDDATRKEIRDRLEVFKKKKGGGG